MKKKSTPKQTQKSAAPKAAPTPAPASIHTPRVASSPSFLNLASAAQEIGTWNILVTIPAEVISRLQRLELIRRFDPSVPHSASGIEYLASEAIVEYCRQEEEAYGLQDFDNLPSEEERKRITEKLTAYHAAGNLRRY
jgi:hypothetical protein